MLVYLFVALAIALRFATAPIAFTSMNAALLYFGARGSRRHAWIPLAMAMGADVALTRFLYGYPVTWDHFVTWAWYAVVLLLGTRIGASNSPLRIGGAALASSLGFFVVSNLAVWASWNMYPKTLGGLATCYVMAIPFYRTALACDLLFSAAFFGLPVLLGMRSGAARQASV
jgi:hypothetical protein